MSFETVFAAGYTAFLTCAAFALEWLSAHTHQRALRYRTAGFTYNDHHDHWQCPEGELLWPYEVDSDSRLIRYRARAHVCNSCRSKQHCTDSDRGREIIRSLDPWPNSEAGRFHRIIGLLLVALGVLIVIVELARHHTAIEIAILLGLLVLLALTGRYLLRDLHVHPANFPTGPSSVSTRLAAGVKPPRYM
jgi:hypothetical protein